MAKVSINNLVKAIYESSYEKTDGELDDICHKIVNLISEKHLLGKSKDILEKLERMIDQNEDVIRAKITSRNKLDKKTQEEIEDFIRKRYRVKKVILSLSNDEKLLGGVKIEIKDEVIDTTLKNKISKLKNYLITN